MIVLQFIEMYAWRALWVLGGRLLKRMLRGLRRDTILELICVLAELLRQWEVDEDTVKEVVKAAYEGRSEVVNDIKAAVSSQSSPACLPPAAAQPLPPAEGGGSPPTPSAGPDRPGAPGPDAPSPGESPNKAGSGGE